jgi:hypothetical protein
MVTVLLSAALLAPAGAAQMKASDPPHVAGPLALSNETYSGDPCRREVIKVGGEVAAVGRFCTWFYRFDPGAESDAGRDYGVWWIQSDFKPRNGWCAKQLNTGIAMSSGTEVTAFTRKKLDLSTGRKVTIRLRPDAGGTSATPGLVRNSFVMRPGTYRSRFVSSNSNLKMVWKGATKKPAAFAGGLEASWPANSGPPAFLPNASAQMQKPC